MFNSFDTLFIVRSVELLEIAIKGLSTQKFFFHFFYWLKWCINYSRTIFKNYFVEKNLISNFLRLFSESTYNCKVTMKLMPWPCHQMELSSPSLELILPFQSIVLTVPSSQVWNDGFMFVHGYESTQKMGFIAVKHRETLNWNVLTVLSVHWTMKIIFF